MSKIKQLNLEQKLGDLKILINRNEVEDTQSIITIYQISKLFDISLIESSILLNKFVLNENDISQYKIFFLCEILDDSGKNLTKKIISSCNKNINEILEDKKHTLSFGIFGICKIDYNFDENDFGAFIMENILIKKYDYSNFSDTLYKGVKSNSNNKKSTTKSENQTKKNLKQNKPISKQENNNIKNSKKPNIISDKEEENYYGGFMPKKEKPKPEKNVINLGGNLKRKKSEKNDECSSKENKSKKSRKYSNKSNDTEKSRSKSKNKIGEIEPIKEEDVEMKDDNQPKKVRRSRLVKKSKQFMDDEGYMVTKEVMEEEEFWEEEKPKQKIEKNNNIICEGKKEGKKNNKKLAKGQTSINAFFGK